MALSTYHDDIAPPSSSPQMPSGPSPYQTSMISRTWRCAFHGWPQ